MLDTPFELDVRLVNRVVRRAEIFSVFFPWFGHALIFDARHDQVAGPAVFADEMARSVDERLASLAMLRPSFSRPERLTAIPWPAGVDSFVEVGVYDQVVARCRRLGFPKLERDCDRALAELKAAERSMKLAYVRGEQGRAIYQQ